MGCLFSRPEFDLTPNPRIFQVWNVDSEGRNVKPGKIEVTESQLILYQRGDITVRWPLRSLRRYGFDAELFSFECGRRCPTGSGVYAFKCRRAEILFNILQECIQNSGGGNGNISVAALDEQLNAPPPPVVAQSSASTSGSLANGSAAAPHRQITGVDFAGYLEPISGSSSFPVQYHPALAGSSQSAQSAPPLQSSSPGGFVTIHSAGTSSGGPSVEWSAGLPAPSFPPCCSCSCNFGLCSQRTSHNYVNDVVDHHACVSGCPSEECRFHQYVNSSVMDNSHTCCASQHRYLDQSGNAYINGMMTSTCTAVHPRGLRCAMNCVDLNTNYAKLDELMKQEQSVKRHKEEHHFYVNVKREEQDDAGSASEGTYLPERCSRAVNQSQNCAFSVPAQMGAVPFRNSSSHYYANITPISGNLATDTNTEPEYFPEVNYAVLDLDQTSEAVGNGLNAGVSLVQASTSTTFPPATTGVSLPNPPPQTPEGYVQIDFDRTAALSNSSNPCPLNDESIRKTRHNAATPPASTHS